LLSKSLFDFIEYKVPEDFLNKNIHDLGCGDGYGTVKIKEIFKASDITGYEIVKKQVERARQRGIRTETIDLNKNVPRGEMATLWFTLHHLNDKENTLKKIMKNYDYIVIAESIKSWKDIIFEGGITLPKKDWIRLFDEVLGKYQTLQLKNVLFIFWKRREK